ncbi:ATP-binding protein [Telmatospirillum sp.]|uniref:ATP-binding protein n=1 Tax=Telmatospirillum sp. TaxID=2079197 RepID=UPI00283C64CF|nr:ATP-binding protein [Telmatospirillum sp.]MDR3438653.1 ATP-binding protein [Telmatospirillum sp.]
MRFWVPDTAQGQIIAILLGALLTTFATISLLLTLARPDVPPPPPGPWPGALSIATVIKALHAAPPEAREAIAEAVSKDEMLVRIGSPQPCAELPPSRYTRDMELVLRNLLTDRFGSLTFRRCGEGAMQIEAPLDGTVVTVRTVIHHDFSQFIIATLPLTVCVSFLLILIVALSLWTLWRVNRPLRQMASTAEKFGLDVAVAPLSEQGPREFRRLAQTLNRMQQRIAQLIDQRSHMLMAVGHDLRTPLTRLKLRIELDDMLADRQDLLCELDLMHRMINGALSFLNNRRNSEAIEEVDVGALVESICIGFADSGKHVAYAGGYGLNYPCQPTAVSRAVNNLIENGCRYGNHVVANVLCQDHDLVIEITDDGPGIPAEKREAVLEPFARLDPARASDGGLGLGLSIVRDVVRRHGGLLTLGEAEPRGLKVRILFPFKVEP